MHERIFNLFVYTADPAGCQSFLGQTVSSDMMMSTEGANLAQQAARAGMPLINYCMCMLLKSVDIHRFYISALRNEFEPGP